MRSLAGLSYGQALKGALKRILAGLLPIRKLGEAWIPAIALAVIYDEGVNLAEG